MVGGKIRPADDTFAAISRDFGTSVWQLANKNLYQFPAHRKGRVVAIWATKFGDTVGLPLPDREGDYPVLRDEV